MKVRTSRSSLTGSARHATPAVLALAGLLFAAILALRLVPADEAGPIMLLAVLPIALIAFELGRYGGSRAATRRMESERKQAEKHRGGLLGLLETIARTDELTGLSNRIAFDEALRREIARAERTHEPLSVAIVDLDRFKAYNDRHGHLAGDRLLVEAAAVWQVALRRSDLIARFGGEEFVLLLPDCPLKDAVRVVERVRTATPQSLTASAGIACWDGSESGEELMVRADTALYEAKRSGRDRVLVAR